MISFETLGYHLDCWIERIRYRLRPPPPSSPASAINQAIARMMIKEAARTFRSRNAFLDHMESYDKDQPIHIGQSLRIRLPKDWPMTSTGGQQPLSEAAEPPTSPQHRITCNG